MILGRLLRMCFSKYVLFRSKLSLCCGKKEEQEKKEQEKKSWGDYFKALLKAFSQVSR